LDIVKGSNIGCPSGALTAPFLSEYPLIFHLYGSFPEAVYRHETACGALQGAKDLDHLDAGLVLFPIQVPERQLDQQVDLSSALCVR